jgi:hypothetical protein
MLVLVFDGPPGPEGPRFIEAEDGRGNSINAGWWREREDGNWELAVDQAVLPKPSKPTLVPS